MYRHNLEILTKIGVLSLSMLLVIQGAIYTLSHSGVASADSHNELIYPSARSQSISQVGVALGTGIGVRFDTAAYNQTISYNTAALVGATSEESREIRKKLIADNMIIVKEYLGLLKNNPLEVMEQSNNRRNALNTFISQLELRFRNATLSQASLQSQKDLLVADMEAIKSDIENVKSDIGLNFSGSQATATLNDVDQYLELRRKYRENFTDVVFINQFLVQYNFLNNYNKNLLDTLINNKEALINKSFVVIPDSGDDFLRDFNLLYEEADFKAVTQ